MRKPLIAAVALLCGASLTQPLTSFAQTQPDQPPAQSGSPPSTQPEGAQGDPKLPCQSFTAPVTIGGGKQVQATGRSCQQADGSLQITLNAPGLPMQVYTMRPLQEPLPSPPAASQQQPLPQAPAPPATYDYAAPYPYAYVYPPPALYPPPPPLWSNPWAFGGFPFFAGRPIFFVHDHFFFRNRFRHPFFFAGRVVIVDRFRHFHHAFPQSEFAARGFHSGVPASGFAMGGSFHGGVGGRR